MSTTTEPAKVAERAARLIRTVCGESWGDGETVTDIGHGIVDGDPDAVWVAGDWNDRTRFDPETRQWITTDDTPGRLLAALERVGVQAYWYDTVSTCPECYRLIETEVMYGTPPAMWSDAGYVCLECVARDLDAYTEDYVNDSDRALPSQLDSDALIAAGWEYTGADHRSGWYGRHDSPAEVLAEILADSPEGTEVVFQVTDAHMFELGFTTWTRTPEPEDDDTEE